MTKSGRQDGGEVEGGEPLQNLILLRPLIPQGAGKARWQNGGAALETKGLELRGTGRVVTPTPQAPFEQGKTEMAFPVLRKSRSFSEFRSRMGRGLQDRGKDRSLELHPSPVPLPLESF